jgi:hypothetical protein
MFMTPDGFHMPANLQESDEVRELQDIFRQRVTNDNLRETFESPASLKAAVALAIGNWSHEQLGRKEPSQQVALGISNGSAEGGQLALVTITATCPSPGIGAYTVYVRYDPRLLRAVSSRSSSLDYSHIAFSNHAFAPDAASFAGASAKPLEGTFEIGTLALLATGHDWGPTELTLEVVELVDREGNSVLPDYVGAGELYIAGADQ